MLVLTRELGEAIVILQLKVRIAVLRASKSRVRLGISAPMGTAIYGEDVYCRMPRRNIRSRISTNALPDESRIGGQLTQTCNRQD